MLIVPFQQRTNDHYSHIRLERRRDSSRRWLHLRHPARAAVHARDHLLRGDERPREAEPGIRSRQRRVHFSPIMGASAELFDPSILIHSRDDHRGHCRSARLLGE